MVGTSTKSVTQERRMSVKIADTLLSECQNGNHPKIAGKWGYVGGMTLMALERAAEWNQESATRNLFSVTWMTSSRMTAPFGPTS